MDHGQHIDGRRHGLWLEAGWWVIWERGDLVARVRQQEPDRGSTFRRCCYDPPGDHPTPQVPADHPRREALPDALGPRPRP